MVGLYVLFLSVVLLMVVIVLRVLLGSLTVLVRVLGWVLVLLVRLIFVLFHLGGRGVDAIRDWVDYRR